MGSFNSDRKFNRRDSGKSEGRSSSRFDRGDSDNSERREPRRFGSGGFNRPERGSSDRFERRSSGRSSFEKQMHEVICDKCGKKCEVPFRPTEGKPVYCSDCFRKNESTDFKQPNDFKQPSNSGRELEQINQKLDKILSLLEKN